MTKDEMRAAFLSMLPKRKMSLLALWAHNLTICARSATLPEVNDSTGRKRLGCLNEVLHVATGQLIHLVTEDANRYPDDVFIAILFEKAQMGQCERDLVQAFEWSRSANLPGSTV